MNPVVQIIMILVKNVSLGAYTTGMFLMTFANRDELRKFFNRHKVFRNIYVALGVLGFIVFITDLPVVIGWAKRP